MNPFISILSISCVLALSSCHMGHKIWENSSSNPEKAFGIYPNKIDSNAKYITGQYAKEQNLSGNVIARFPDFHMRLLSTEIKNDETISLFEVSSKNGLERTEIRCSTKDPDKKHLYIEDMHFFYHSDQPGMINIYIPQILMASNKLFTNNTE